MMTPKLEPTAAPIMAGVLFVVWMIVTFAGAVGLVINVDVGLEVTAEV